LALAIGTAKIEGLLNFSPLRSRQIVNGCMGFAGALAAASGALGLRMVEPMATGQYFCLFWMLRSPRARCTSVGFGICGILGSGLCISVLPVLQASGTCLHACFFNVQGTSLVLESINTISIFLTP